MLCDGNNGTPHLRDRFIVGAGSSYSLGGTGGAATIALSVAQMPSHNHSASSNTTGDHQHGFTVNHGWNGLVYVGFSDQYWNEGKKYTDVAGAHSHTITVNYNGGNQAHENRPPYYALYYIMKL